MSRIANLANKQTIKEYAQGAAKQAFTAVADFLAPTVQVGGMSGYYKTYGQKQVRRVVQTRRAMNGPAVQLHRDATDTAYLLEAHAIDCPVDEMLLNDESAAENELMSAADEAAEAGALNHEKQVIDMALAAVGSGTNSNFASGSVDPVDVLDEQIAAVMLAAGGGGLMGVRLLFGVTAARRFKNNSNVRARFLGGAGAGGKSGGGGASLVTPSLGSFRELLMGNPEVQMSFMVADGAQEGKAASNAFLLDTAILIFACRANPTRNDPSFMKTFRPRGAWMVPGSYKREDGRGEVAKMDWYSLPAVVNSAAAVRINATAS